MKKLFPIILLFLLNTEIKAQWHTIVPYFPNTFYNELSFPKDDTGFYNDGYVVRTNDGGSSYDTLTIPTLSQFQSIYFRNGMDGVVSGTNGNSKIYRSMDNGNNWTDISPVNMLGTPVFAEMHSPVKGMCLTTAPWFYRTFDAGASWDTLSFGYDYFNSVSFPDSMNGYVGGFDGTFGYRGEIAKTSDGGATWSLVTHITTWNTDIAQIQFVNKDTGFAIYTSQNGVSPIIRTVDGAASWDTVYFPNGHVTHISFLNHNFGYLVNDSGSVWRTTDMGLTWTFDFHPPGSFAEITVTPHYAYAGGSPGLLYKRDWLSSIHEFQVSGYTFQVEPNPAVNEVTLKGDAIHSGNRFDLLDVQGRTITSIITSNEGEAVFDVSSLSQGVYFIRTASGEAIRFVKE